jgi:hypothetical protein
MGLCIMGMAHRRVDIGGEMVGYMALLGYDGKFRENNLSDARSGFSSQLSTLPSCSN